jgi:hypothetical protein
MHMSEEVKNLHVTNQDLIDLSGALESYAHAYEEMAKDTSDDKSWADTEADQIAYDRIINLHARVRDALR